MFVGLIFVSLSAEFGGGHTKADKLGYSESGHYKEGRFINLITTKMDMGFKNMFTTIKEFSESRPGKFPSAELLINYVNSLEIVNNRAPRLIWFGHSAFLLQFDGKTILLDPMLGKTPAPHPLLETNGYSKALSIEIEKLPSIDAIIISHDHYDHLDYGSIKKLKHEGRKLCSET